MHRLGRHSVKFQAIGRGLRQQQQVGALRIGDPGVDGMADRDAATAIGHARQPGGAQRMRLRQAGSEGEE